MNIPELIKKIKEAGDQYGWALHSIQPDGSAYTYDDIEWHHINKGDELLEKVIKELEQQIDDGK